MSDVSRFSKKTADFYYLLFCFDPLSVFFFVTNVQDDPTKKNKLQKVFKKPYFSIHWIQYLSFL